MDEVAHRFIGAEAFAIDAADGGSALATHPVRAVAASAAQFEALPAGRERFRSRLEDQCAEVLGHMIRIAMEDAGGLPTEEMAALVRRRAFDAIEVGAPLRAGRDGGTADRAKRDAGGGIPDVGGFVDARGSGPPGPQGGVVTLAIEVDGQIDPIAGGRDFEFAIAADVGPIVAQEHFDDVAVPELIARARAQSAT